MITRGIVEQIVNKYNIKVRIPTIHQSSAASTRVKTEDINSAVICTSPNTNPNIQVGDVVFIAFEDNNYGNPVIIGYLYRDAISSTYIDSILNSLSVNIEAKLPETTCIGKVTESEIKCLIGCQDNIQHQLNQLNAAINGLQSQINSLKAVLNNKGGDI